MYFLSFLLSLFSSPVLSAVPEGAVVIDVLPEGTVVIEVRPACE
jgi:hypothetical protein